MPPNRFESEVESFLEGSHGDRTHIKRADHHTVTPLCGTLLVGLPRPLAGRVLYRKWHRMRDKVLPARVVGGGSGTKFSLHAKSGPKSAFWGLLGEFCTGWAAEPGSRASFVSLRARRGLHRAFLAPIAPPIDAAVMRCRYTWARRPCPTGRREPHPGSVGYAFIARRKPPARASCAGGRQRKHQQASASNASSANQTTGRPQAVQASRTHFFSSVTR